MQNIEKCHKNDAIRQVEATALIFVKSEKLWEEISAPIPDRIILVDELEGKCDDSRRAFVDVLKGLSIILTIRIEY